MKLLILLAFFAGLLSCEPYQATNPNGPNGSWWVGGSDGGVYVFIEDDTNSTDDIYQGVIYYEHDHSIWYKGKFKYNLKSPLDFKNKQIYSGWDGEKLFLKDNSYLQATGKILP